MVLACETVRHYVDGTPLFVDVATVRAHYSMGQRVGVWCSGAGPRGTAGWVGGGDTLTDARAVVERWCVAASAPTELLPGLAVDGDMTRLARKLADRNGWRFLGIVQAPGLVESVPMAQLEDGHGQLHQRTIEDLRAEKFARERADKRPAGDGRTLALF